MVDVWITSSIAAAGVADLLKYTSLNLIFVYLLNGRFVQEKFTPLDIEKGTNLTHLKRVRKSGETTEDGFDIIEIILCAVSTVSREDLDRIANEAHERGIRIAHRMAKVSKWPAYNPRQLAEFKSLWPVVLRKDTTR